MGDHYTFSELRKERGWSEKLVKELLGDPDETRPNPHYRTGPHPMRLYATDRVHAAEQDERFVAHHKRWETRSDAAYEAAYSKRSKLLRWAETVPITVQRLPLQEVYDRAIESREAWHEHQSALRGRWEGSDAASADAATQTRWAVNYIRHELTAYDDTLLDAYGKTRVSAAAAVIKRRVLSEIGKLYPEVAEECIRQSN